MYWLHFSVVVTDPNVTHVKDLGHEDYHSFIVIDSTSLVNKMTKAIH